jgi:hypothetical protein
MLTEEMKNKIIAAKKEEKQLRIEQYLIDTAIDLEICPYCNVNLRTLFPLWWFIGKHYKCDSCKRTFFYRHYDY